MLGSWISRFSYDISIENRIQKLTRISMCSPACWMHFLARRKSKTIQNADISAIECTTRRRDAIKKRNGGEWKLLHNTATTEQTHFTYDFWLQQYLFLHLHFCLSEFCFPTVYWVYIYIIYFLLFHSLFGLGPEGNNDKSSMQADRQFELSVQLCDHPFVNSISFAGAGLLAEVVEPVFMLFALHTCIRIELKWY